MALAGAAAAQTRTAPQVIADVQKTYAGVTDMTAVFEQKVTNVTFGRTHAVGGKVYVKRPSRMRWDYNTKPAPGQPARTAKSFIADGTWLWMIDLENQQILKQSVKGQLLPVAVAFLSGSTTWAADFRAKLDTSGTYGATGDHVVLLTPRKAAAYKKLYLVVDPATAQVRESIIVDAADNVNHFSFMSSNLAATNRDKLFEVDETSAMFANFRIITPPAPPPAARPRARPRKP
jgi:outer membrane lipoprotein-sorting protein